MTKRSNDGGPDALLVQVLKEQRRPLMPVDTAPPERCKICGKLWVETPAVEPEPSLRRYRILKGKELDRLEAHINICAALGYDFLPPLVVHSNNGGRSIYAVMERREVR